MLDNIKAKFPDMSQAVITVEISGYTHDGLGVGRCNGRVVFIKGALLGEKVQAEIVAERRGVFYARLLLVLVASKQRRAPECPVYEQCGGCQLQHMSYAEELDFKAGQVQAALSRLGGLSGFEQRPICGAVESYHYRNKGVFHVSRQEGRVQLGFWDENSHQPAGATCSLLFPPLFVRALELLESREAGLPELPEAVNNVLLRYSLAQNKLLLMLEINNNKAEKDCRAYLQQLADFLPELAVWGIKQGMEYQVFSSEQYLMDKLGNTEYQIAPGAFFQVNNAQTLKLLETARAALAGNCRVLLDIYCGIGTFGLYLAKNLPGLERLAGIELNSAAVEMATANACLNGISKAEFWQGRAEDKFTKLQARYKNIDAVVIDPPRRGCDKRFLTELLKLSPGRIVYVSCNPASLARDLQMLCTGGYGVEFVQPVDMFPRTHHVETVVMLSHKKTDSVINVKVEFGQGEGKVPLDNIAKRAAAYKPKERVTYKMIKEYIEAKYGFKVQQR